MRSISTVMSAAHKETPMDDNPVPEILPPERHDPMYLEMVQALSTMEAELNRVRDVGLGYAAELAQVDDEREASRQRLLDLTDAHHQEAVRGDQLQKWLDASRQIQARSYEALSQAREIFIKLGWSASPGGIIAKINALLPCPVCHGTGHAGNLTDECCPECHGGGRLHE